MCMEDYRIRRHCYVRTQPVISTVAGSYLFPADPRRVGISYHPRVDTANIYEGDGSDTNKIIAGSTATSPNPLLHLDFIKHGPIVQRAFVIVDSDAVGGEVAYETLLDRDLDKLIQGVL